MFTIYYVRVVKLYSVRYRLVTSYIISTAVFIYLNLRNSYIWFVLMTPVTT